MKRISLFLLLATATITNIKTDSNFPLKGNSFFSTRSQSVNAARSLAGIHRYIHKVNTDSFYQTFAVTPAFTRSFNERRLAQYFFGCNELSITGSQVTNRFVNDILADYFGLSPAFQSTVIVKPEVSNAIVDFNYYAGWRDFYLQVYAPFARTRSQIKLNETVTNNGTDTQYPIFYMDHEELNAPLQSWSEAMHCPVTFGQVQEKLQYGKIGCCTRKKVADVHCNLGWNFIRRESGHAGLNIRLTIPTGTRSTAQYLFEPVIGNGHHIGLGLGYNGSKLLWEYGSEQQIYIHLDTFINHLLKSKQKRSFDLKENFGSRYILLKTFDENDLYDGTLIPAINRTTLDCDVRINAQFELTVMAAYQNRGLTLDFGYNFWARTRELIDLKECIAEKTYGLKGIQTISNATQSDATLHGNLYADQNLHKDPTPVFITNCDIDKESGASPRALTHKFFTHLGFSWLDKEEEEYKFIPFIGAGFEIEFEGTHDKEYLQPNKNSLAQWGVWVKAGFTV